MIDKPIGTAILNYRLLLIFQGEELISHSQVSDCILSSLFAYFNNNSNVKFKDYDAVEDSSILIQFSSSSDDMNLNQFIQGLTNQVDKDLRKNFNSVIAEYQALDKHVINRYLISSTVDKSQELILNKFNQMMQSNPQAIKSQ